MARSDRRVDSPARSLMGTRRLPWWIRVVGAVALLTLACMWTTLAPRLIYEQLQQDAFFTSFMLGGAVVLAVALLCGALAVPVLGSDCPEAARVAVLRSELLRYGGAGLARSFGPRAARYTELVFEATATAVLLIGLAFVIEVAEDHGRQHSSVVGASQGLVALTATACGCAVVLTALPGSLVPLVRLSEACRVLSAFLYAARAGAAAARGGASTRVVVPGCPLALQSWARRWLPVLRSISVQPRAATTGPRVALLLLLMFPAYLALSTLAAAVRGQSASPSVAWLDRWGFCWGIVVMAGVVIPGIVGGKWLAQVLQPLNGRVRQRILKKLDRLLRLLRALHEGTARLVVWPTQLWRDHSRVEGPFVEIGRRVALAAAAFLVLVCLLVGLLTAGGPAAWLRCVGEAVAARRVDVAVSLLIAVGLAALAGWLKRQRRKAAQLCKIGRKLYANYERVIHELVSRYGYQQRAAVGGNQGGSPETRSKTAMRNLCVGRRGQLAAAIMLLGLGLLAGETTLWVIAGRWRLTEPRTGTFLLVLSVWVSALVGSLIQLNLLWTFDAVYECRVALSWLQVASGRDATQQTGNRC